MPESQGQLRRGRARIQRNSLRNESPPTFLLTRASTTPVHARSSRLPSQGWPTWIRTTKTPNFRIRTQRPPGVPLPCQQTVPIGSHVRALEVTGNKHEILEHCLPHLQLWWNARIVRGERIVRVNRVEACMQSAAYLLALCALLWYSRHHSAPLPSI